MSASVGQHCANEGEQSLSWRKILAVAVIGLGLVTGCKSKSNEELDQAGAYLSKGDYGRALKIYQSITAKFPAGEVSAKAMFLIGEINYLYLKKPQEAIEAYEEFVHTYPNDPNAQPARLNLARIYEEDLDKPQSAITCYQRVIDFADDNDQEKAPYSRWRIARNYDALGQTEQAMVEAQILLEKYPRNKYAEEAKLLLADIEYMKGDYEKAAMAYGNILTKLPDSTAAGEARLGRAACYEEQGKLEEALADYTFLLPTHPEPEVIKRRIARLKAKLHEKKGKWQTDWK